MLATGDIHVVPLRTRPGPRQRPSKTYSILAAGRPLVAAIDAGTEVPALLAESGGGVAVAPDDADAFTAALRRLRRRPGRRRGDGPRGPRMGRALRPHRRAVAERVRRR